MVAVALLDGEAAADAGLLAALRDDRQRGLRARRGRAVARGRGADLRRGLRALVAAGELAAAREDGRVVGCVRVTSLDPRTAELGLLAVAGERSRVGRGRALMAFAHDLARGRGHTAMRLTLLVPQEGSHPFKVRLDELVPPPGLPDRRARGLRGDAPGAGAASWSSPCDLVTFERALG